jgi:hypothetical protein
MRDLTKSMARLSWAMSLYGLDRMRDVLEGESPVEGEAAPGAATRGAHSLDSLSEATGERLRDRTRRVYEAGDRLQTEMIDLVFDAAEPVREGFEHLFDNAANWAERSAETLRKAARQREDAAATTEGEATGKNEAQAEAAAEA